jgi:DNA-binding XRE family transcriptional regulator
MFGLSKAKVALLLNVSYKTMLRWANNEIEPCLTFTQIKTLMEYTDCTFEEIVAEFEKCHLEAIERKHVA